MTNLHRYYKDNKDDINSSIMELASDLAAGRLMNEHGRPFEAFIEPDDPDDPKSGTHYKEEFQAEFDRYYDEQYDRIARLVKFDFNADDGVVHNNADDRFEETDTPDPDRLVITDKVCDVIDVITTPDTHLELFRRRVKCLTSSGHMLEMSDDRFHDPAKHAATIAALSPYPSSESGARPSRSFFSGKAGAQRDFRTPSMRFISRRRTVSMETSISMLKA